MNWNPSRALLVAFALGFGANVSAQSPPRSGLGFSFGMGAALTPCVTYLDSMEVAADVNGVSTGVNLNPNILQFGLAITTR